MMRTRTRIAVATLALSLASACAPYATAQREQAFRVIDGSGAPVRFAAVTFVTTVSPSGVERGREEALTGGDGVVRFDAIFERRPAGAAYGSAWCVAAPGYATRRSAEDAAARATDVRTIVVRLAPGRSTPCPPAGA